MSSESFGQPSVECVQRAEENQVSSTSGSWNSVRASARRASLRRLQRDDGLGGQVGEDVQCPGLDLAPGEALLAERAVGAVLQAVLRRKDQVDRVLRAVQAVPGRNAVAPPQLSADAPVSNVLHPVEVDPRIAVRHDLDPTVLDHLHCGPGQVIHADEPLPAGQRLHDHAAPAAVAHGVAVRLLPVEQAGGVQVPKDDLPALSAVHALVRAGLAAHGAVQVDGGDYGQAVTLAHLEVDGIVAGRDLERARAELRVDGVVADDGQRPVEHGQQDAAPTRWR